MIRASSSLLRWRSTAGPLAATTSLLQRVDLKLIQELRFRTDAPISDCNSALKECNLDLDAAAEWLKKKGIAKATKKEGRVTENGLVVAAIDRVYGGGVITLCSETDFASRNAHFSTTAATVRNKLLDIIVSSKGESLRNPDQLFADLTSTTKETLASAIAVLGENVTLKSFTPIPTPQEEADDVKTFPLAFGKYVHNSISEADAGGIVGLVAVRRLPEAASLDATVLDDLAQHFVGSSGDTSNYVHQNFLGSSDTVGQWLKKHHVKLQCGMVLPFGKQPIVTFPAVPRRPKA